MKVIFQNNPFRMLRRNRSVLAENRAVHSSPSTKISPYEGKATPKPEGGDMANIITVSRTLAAFAMVFTEVPSPAFWVLYAWCGLSRDYFSRASFMLPVRYPRTSRVV